MKLRKESLYTLRLPVSVHKCTVSWLETKVQIEPVRSSRRELNDQAGLEGAHGLDRSQFSSTEDVAHTLGCKQVCLQRKVAS